MDSMQIPESEQPSTLWVETDSHGLIYDLGPAAAGLLGFSRRGAFSRDLRMFFPGSYRPLNALLREASARWVAARYTLHPRDRRPVPVELQIGPAPEPASPDSSRPRLRWMLTPLDF
jgi:hypothetical protein